MEEAAAYPDESMIPEKDEDEAAGKSVALANVDEGRERDASSR